MHEVRSVSTFRYDKSNLVFFSNLLLPPLRFSPTPPPLPPSPSGLALFSALRGSVSVVVPLVPLPLETLPLQPRTTAVAFGFLALSF